MRSATPTARCSTEPAASRNFVKIVRTFVKGPMGELIQPGTTAPWGALLPMLVAAAGLGLYAVMGPGSENDDDDSTPGGGLMQPVA